MGQVWHLSDAGHQACPTAPKSTQCMYVMVGWLLWAINRCGRSLAGSLGSQRYEHPYEHKVTPPTHLLLDFIIQSEIGSDPSAFVLS
jgi:hypothetical protein